MHDDHDDDHDHHGHGSELSPMDARVRALETILTEKGYVDPKALDLIIETYETKIGPRNGAKVVAKAWLDPDYKARLMKDATAAIAELGYAGRQGEHMVARRWRTRARFTILSFAPFAPAIRFRCWDCRRFGTNPLRIARAQSWTLAECCRISG